MRLNCDWEGASREARLRNQRRTLLTYSPNREGERKKARGRKPEAVSAELYAHDFNSVQRRGRIAMLVLNGLLFVLLSFAVRRAWPSSHTKVSAQ